MDETQRDSKGRYLPGNEAAKGVNSKPPGQEITLHPKYHYLDSRGRFLPGVDGHAATRLPRLSELKQALVEAISPEDIQTAIRALYDLCLSPTIAPEDRIKAFDLFFNRVIGRPSQEVLLEKHVTQTKVSLDFSKVSSEELRQMENILSKAQGPVIEVEPIKGENA